MKSGLLIFSGENFYSIAAVFSGSAYLMSNILWLRILLVVAAIIYIISSIRLGNTSMIGCDGVCKLKNKNEVQIDQTTRLDFIV